MDPLALLLLLPFVTAAAWVAVGLLVLVPAVSVRWRAHGPSSVTHQTATRQQPQQQRQQQRSDDPHYPDPAVCQILCWAAKHYPRARKYHNET
jgi:UPF0716 family protein affecting phage T7 exclusion